MITQKKLKMIILGVVRVSQPNLRNPNIILCPVKNFYMIILIFSDVHLKAQLKNIVKTIFLNCRAQLIFFFLQMCPPSCIEIIFLKNVV